MPINFFIPIGMTVNLIANQVYSLPSDAVYIATWGTAPTVSMDGTTFVALPTVGPLFASKIKSADGTTFVTLKRT